MPVIKTFLHFQRKYRLVTPLGKGGYGTVYLAKNITTRGEVAVKIMDDARCKNRTWCEESEQSLPNEIVLWETLQHDNIVSLVDVYYNASAALWYLVMEYHPGYEDLFSYVEMNGPMSTRNAAAIIKQLVKVCYYFTSRAIDHRDIKDENILYNPKTKHIKLIDFGSSSRLCPCTAYTTFRGTDVYIPPEYYNTGKYHAFPSTVWAIGCLSYTLLDGYCPFNSTEDIKNFKSVEELKHELGNQTKRNDFIRSCLEPVPEQRLRFTDLLAQPWLKR